jgi:TonB family protein
MIWMVLALQAAAPVTGGPTPAMPIGYIGDWVSPNDYPAKALREGAQGVVGFRLTIGVDGRVSGCEITATAGSSDLDEATCRLVAARARFRPARDAQGEPAVGSYANRMKWSIPKQIPAPAPTALIVSFTVGIDGSISDCVIEQGAGMGAVCPVGGFDTNYRDANGVAVARRVRITKKVEILSLPGQ